MKKFQTASKRKLDSFGTADIPISTPIPTTTSPWHRFAIGQPKTEKASNKPTTSTATKSVFLLAQNTQSWIDSLRLAKGNNRGKQKGKEFRGGTKNKDIIGMDLIINAFKDGIIV